MENSLQEIAGSFTFLGMKTKWIASLALALLPTALVVPTSAASTPNCVGENCEITFSYVGEHQVWSPPQGIKDLSFEIYGAAGGRGGAGGKVSGTFTEVPQTLYIFTGGAGGMGSGIDGGFNGGGFSGGNSGTEGSGGGASDIRLDLTLESRIVVAGGGGGGGGEAGGNGGHGGMEFAAHGGSGQASGGGGATQTEGGFAGVSNGGFQASSPGQFGFGGSGGFSTFAGGGGGGGGWYGGGGGGADDNTCCSDGGGGGGGSSYANTNYVTNISHEAGVSWGHGWVTFRYTLVPAITYFELIQVSSSLALFSIEASEQFIGLEPSDFELVGEGCVFSDLTLSGSIGSGEVSDCQSGEVTLTLAAESFGSGAQGPAQPITAQLNFDADAPTFEFLTDPAATSASSIAIDYSVSDELQLTAELFSLSGCAELELEPNQLLLSSCSEGVVAITLLPNTLQDIWQNTGPDQPITLSFTVDQSAPTASWSDVLVSGSGPFNYSAQLVFSEPVSISNMALAFASTAQCESSTVEHPDRIDVEALCSHTTLEWTFVGTIQDQAGNSSAISGLSVRMSNPAPAPPPPAAPAPVFIPVPVIAEPVIPSPVVQVPSDPSSDSPELTEPDPVATEEGETTSSESLAVPVAETPGEQAATGQAPTAVVSPQRNLEPEPVEVPEPIKSEPESSVAPEPEATSEPQVIITEAAPEPELAQQVMGEELALEQPGFPWWPVALLLAIGALGVGAWRLSGR